MRSDCYPQVISVALTIGGLDPAMGGPSRSVPSLCDALAGSCVHVELLSLEFGESSSPPILPADSRVNTSLTLSGRGAFGRVLSARRLGRKLLALCRSRRVQIIHDTGVWLPSNHIAARTARYLKVPFISSPRGILDRHCFEYHTLKKRLAWQIYQRRDLESAAVIHATAHSEATALRKLGLKNPIAVIPNGVSAPVSPHAPPISPNLRRALFLSRIHPKKGLTDLVRAWCALRPPCWTLTIAGPDEDNHAQELRHLALTLGADGSIEFIGAVDDNAKWGLYRSADLFVLPSYSENFGIVIAEALGSGVPVITTRATPWQDLIEHRCGWWIETGAKSLADALREATNLSENERKGMGSRGRELVKDKFCWSRVAEEMQAVYEWVLGRRHRPACIC